MRSIMAECPECERKSVAMMLDDSLEEVDISDITCDCSLTNEEATELIDKICKEQYGHE